MVMEDSSELRCAPALSNPCSKFVTLRPPATSNSAKILRNGWALRGPCSNFVNYPQPSLWTSFRHIVSHFLSNWAPQQHLRSPELLHATESLCLHLLVPCN